MFSGAINLSSSYNGSFTIIESIRYIPFILMCIKENCPHILKDLICKRTKRSELYGLSLFFPEATRNQELVTSITNLNIFSWYTMKLFE